MSKVYPNCVKSVTNAPVVVLLIPQEHAGWCQQVSVILFHRIFSSFICCLKFAEEGYNVFHVVYPSTSDGLLAQALDAAADYVRHRGGDWGIISYGLFEKDAKALLTLAKKSGSDAHQLQACVHYSPLFEEGASLLVKDLKEGAVPLSDDAALPGESDRY